MNEKKKTILGAALFLAFAAMCIAGYAGGEAELVMTKAVNICLECIGIG